MTDAADNNPSVEQRLTALEQRLEGLSDEFREQASFLLEAISTSHQTNAQAISELTANVNRLEQQIERYLSSQQPPNGKEG